MITNSTILYVKDLLKHNQIQQVSQNIFKLPDHEVQIQTKKGRMLLLCSNASFFGHNQICVGKLAVINFIFNRDTNRQFDTLIALYKNWKEIKLPISVDIMIHDLQNVRDGFT